jgi:hypothetical protein
LTHTKAAVIGARAAWSLNGWELMDTFVSQLPADNIDASFMRAVLAVHTEKYEEASQLIEQTRHHLDDSIRALLAESYGRAYVPLIMVQQCSELEEITEYKMLLKEANLSVSGVSNPAANIPPSASVAAFLNVERDEYFRTPGGSTVSSGIWGLGGSTSAAANRAASSANLAQMSGSSGNFGNRGAIGNITTSIPRSPRGTSVMFSARDANSFGPTGTGSGQGQGQAPMSPMNTPGGMFFPATAGSVSGSGSGSATGRHGSSGSFGEEVDVAQQALRAEAVRRKNLLAEKWRRRLKGCVSSGRAAIPFWKYLLNGRRLVLSEREDLDTWLEFASLCRNGGNSALADRVLRMSQRLASSSVASNMVNNVIARGGGGGGGGGGGSGRGGASTGGSRNRSHSHANLDEGTLMMERKIKFALLKQQWAVSDRKAALSGLEALIKSYSTAWGPSSSAVAQEDSTVHLDCLLKLGEWKIAMVEPGEAVDRGTRTDVLNLFSKATLVDPQSYR